jgi:hypothetical protein
LAVTYRNREGPLTRRGAAGTNDKAASLLSKIMK